MSNRGKILICSAEESIRESLKLVLGEDYRLILCENIDQSPEILQNAADVSILFLDIAQQNNVLDMINIIKSNQPSLKIVVTCRHKQAELAQEAVKQGADGYIITPFKAEEILSICK